MSRNWHFYGKPTQVREIEGAWAEFFNTTDLASLPQAFVREAFQNSIDGASGNGPVRIRLYISGLARALEPGLAKKYFGGFFEHIRACGSLQDDWFAIENSDCPFIVFEDFNTVGLSGDESVSDGGDEGNHFYHFFRTVGRSGKESGNRLGRWGIGKFVFVMASQVKCLFGYTVRDVTMPNSNRALLLGQASLEYHTIQNSRYMNEGWFGDCSDPELPAMPISVASAITEFAKDWNLSRGSDRGLSIVVPYAVAFDEDDLLHAVVHEYLGRILTGGLDVELDLSSRSKPISINAVTVESIISDELNRAAAESAQETARWERTLEELRILEKVLNLPSDRTHLMPNISELPIWGRRLPEAAVGDENSELARFAKSARQALDRDGYVKIRCEGSISKRAKTGHVQRTYFDVLISKTSDEGERYYPVFWRNWLRISGRRVGRASRGYRTMVLADDDAISELLGDAEGPAHTEWSHKRPKFVKKQYEYGSEWLTFIRNAPSTLLDLLVGAIRESDDESLAPFFPIPGELGAGGGGGGEEEDTGGEPPPPPPPPPGAVFEAYAVGDGFKLRPIMRAGNKLPAIPKSRMLRIRVAYATARGNPYARWNENDFDLEELYERSRRSKKIKGCSAVVSKERKYEMTVTIDKAVRDLRNVAFELQGFGDTRDLEVEVDALFV